MFIKECYSEVIEVETYNRRDALEPFTVVMQIIKEKYRMFPKVLQRIVGRFSQQTHAHLPTLASALYVCILATALQIALLPLGILGKHDGGWLEMIGHA